MGSQSHPFTTITAFATLSRSGANPNACISIAKLLATTSSTELLTAIGFLLSNPGIVEILASGPKPETSSPPQGQMQGIPFFKEDGTSGFLRMDLENDKPKEAQNPT